MAINIENRNLYNTFIFLLFIYIVLGLITEHFLITRNLLPIACLLRIIYANMKLNTLNIGINNINI